VCILYYFVLHCILYFCSKLLLICMVAVCQPLLKMDLIWFDACRPTCTVVQNVYAQAATRMWKQFRCIHSHAFRRLVHTHNPFSGSATSTKRGEVGAIRQCTRNCLLMGMGGGLHVGLLAWWRHACACVFIWQRATQQIGEWTFLRCLLLCYTTWAWLI